MADPIGLGFVHSLAQPGGNITGFSTYDAELMGKWLGLLKEVAPGVTRVTVMFNPDTTPWAALYVNAIDAAAPTFGMTVTLSHVHDDLTIEEAVAAFARQPGGGLVIPPESFTVTHRAKIIAEATRHHLPTIGMGDMLPRAGGLMSYWMDTIEMHGQAASYIDRILKGANPIDKARKYIQELEQMGIRIRTQSDNFVFCLGELRAHFGIQLSDLIDMFDLEIDSELSSILPMEDIGHTS